MNLDRNNATFEFTLSLFVLVVAAAALVFWALLPDVRESLQLQEMLKNEATKTQKLQLSFDGLYGKKEQLSAEVLRLNDRLENPLDVIALQRWIKQYMRDVSVAPLKRGDGYEVNATIATPTAFYEFVEALDTAPWILGISPPIKMDKADHRIDLSFTLHTARKPID